MKAWIKATIVALLAIFSSSCTFEYDDEERDAYYMFAEKTWSRIEERYGYYYFVCYEFCKDGSYTYWFYEDDEHEPFPIYGIENGRWEVISHGINKDDIRLYCRGGSDTYDVDLFLEGLTTTNFRSDINDYKRIIDELYHSY